MLLGSRALNLGEAVVSSCLAVSQIIGERGIAYFALQAKFAAGKFPYDICTSAASICNLILRESMNRAANKPLRRTSRHAPPS